MEDIPYLAEYFLGEFRPCSQRARTILSKYSPASKMLSTVVIVYGEAMFGNYDHVIEKAAVYALLGLSGPEVEADMNLELLFLCSPSLGSAPQSSPHDALLASSDIGHDSPS